MSMAHPRHFVGVHRLSVGRWSEAAYDLHIGGGKDNPGGQAGNSEVRCGGSEERLSQRFPMVLGIENRRFGEIQEPIDRRPLIERNSMAKFNLYLVAACSDRSTIAGLLLADLVCGGENQWAAPYHHARIGLTRPPRFASATLNLAAPYSSSMKGGGSGCCSEETPDTGSLMNLSPSRPPNEDVTPDAQETNERAQESGQTDTGRLQ